MSASAYVIAILICLLTISLIVNVWAISFAQKTEERYLEWIDELKRGRKW